MTQQLHFEVDVETNRSPFMMTLFMRQTLWKLLYTEWDLSQIILSRKLEFSPKCFQNKKKHLVASLAV